MKNKFLISSLSVLFFSLIFLIYPQVSLATVSVPTITAISSAVGTTTVTLAATVTAAGGDADGAGEVGFAIGTDVDVTAGTTTAYSVNTGDYATATDFTYTTTTCGQNDSDDLAQGTLYYFRAYATSSAGFGYSTSTVFLTGINAPADLTAAATGDTAINFTWTEGTGSQKVVIRYSTGDYPATISDGTEGYFGAGITALVTSLTPVTTYYFRAWSSTTAADSGESTTSESYSQAAVTTAAVGSSGALRTGTIYVPPKVFADSLVINEGAELTSTREVELSLRAEGALYMSICSDNRFVGCPLESYQGTKSWTLTEGDGEKTVYAIFTSSAGKNSTIVSDTIALKTPPAKEVVEKKAPEEEVVQATPEQPKEEVTEAPSLIETIQTKITAIQQKINELLNQLNKLIQEQAASIWTALGRFLKSLFGK